MSKTSKHRWQKGTTANQRTTKTLGLENGRGDVNNKKKAAIVREYRKILKTVGKDGSVENTVTKNHNQHFKRPQKGKMSIFKRAMAEYQHKQNEKEKQKEAWEAARKEREEAIKKYKAKKKEHYKRLAKKTKWGQPVMKNRVEMILEKLQEETNQT